ncbi:unnamed protein product [Orchesella dallaii]|uniref:Protein CDV3 n=1 Tax=Orchesella dallaii TaxID=48710 RepID=A0ABP1QNU6_9HEXA
MADLDDFFAKRDKKKTKGKKFDTTDDLAKVLEQKAKEKKQKETGKSNYAQEGGRTSPGPGLPAAADDDEWLEAEDKAPDYTGLKIQELVLSDEDEEQENQEGKGEGEDPNNEGPWRKKKKSKDEEATAEKEGEAEETKEGSEEKADEETAKGGDGDDGDGSKDEEKVDSETKAYVPPSKRQETTATPSSEPPKSTSAYVPPSRRGAGAGTPSAPIGAASAVPKKKPGTVPTLGDEDSFPSLS